jgi:hypothetical protein
VPVKSITRGGIGFRAHTVFEPGKPHQPCQSLLERKDLIVLRHIPGCTWLEAQPVTLSLEIDGHSVESRYTPDFELETSFGRFLGESKPAEKVLEPEVQARLRAAREYSRVAGYTNFLVLTELHIERQPRLANSMLVKRFKLYPRDETLCFRILDDIDAAEGVTVGGLVARHGNHARSTAIAMIAAGTLTCDINKSLYSASPLWRASTERSKGEGYEDIFNQ